ncbi:GntR family transcriptional regulator [Ahrensia kielensis]|uniref:GntR family transcriptional regulator n=1 Tax=Ahrensia kielensis TaxID=76980 RepID=A0ABU9T3T8_9HYPH
MQQTPKTPKGQGTPSRTDALAETAYKFIRDGISSGELKPEQRITEMQVAEMMGVSRTPVREAIRRLESDGLLVYTSRHGLVVNQLDYHEIVQLYAMREILETNAAELAAQRASDAEINIMTDIVEMEEEADPADASLAARHNRVFHDALHQSAHNRFLLQSMSALSNSMVLLGGTTLSSPERRQAAIAEHRAILSAVRARDQAAASSAMSAHIRNAQGVRLKMIMQSRAKNED